jgi:hypothetical protein
MPRQAALFVLLVAFATACSKKPDANGGTGATPAPQPPGVDSDPNAVYTLAIRGIEPGDTSAVVRRESTTQVVSGGNAGTEKIERRLEYTEHIERMSQALPTRVTRKYTVAEKSDKSGQLQPLPFQGKTVVIERRGAGYHFSIDDKTMPKPDAAELEDEFRQADRVKVEALLPGKSVKVGEEWKVDPAVLRAFGELGPNVDLKRSKLVARLARAYTLDGKQWGQIAFDFDLVIDPDITRGKVRGLEGTFRIDGTFDVVIDNTSRDGIMRGTVKASLTGRHKASESRIEMEGTMEKSVRMVK